MNKYSIFYKGLRKFLIENKLEDESSFVEVSEKEIDNINIKIPLAYKEWLKIFGNATCLLNFPYFEDYSLENLIELQKESESQIKFDEEAKQLLLISSMGLLYIYIVLEEENPTTYFVGLESQFSKHTVEKKQRFTSNIRLHIITLMHHLKNLNELPESIQWFEQKDIIKNLGSFYKEQFLEIEKIEDERGTFFSIPEFIAYFNSKNYR